MPDGSSLPVPEPGMVFICRLCLRMVTAHGNGMDSCGRSDCGGPSAGKAFPLYDGPLAGVLENYCYMCGEESYKAISVDGQKRLGMCKKCLVNVFGVREKTNNQEET